MPMYSIFGRHVSTGKEICKVELKKMSHTVKDNRGKWAPNYEGPFVVKRAFSREALVLTNMDGEELPSPVNSDVVKRYYA